MKTSDLQSEDPNYVGGAIAGGVADLVQFTTRPVGRFDPYSTPNPRAERDRGLYLASPAGAYATGQTFVVDGGELV